MSKAQSPRCKQADQFPGTFLIHAEVNADEQTPIAVESPITSFNHETAAFLRSNKLLVYPVSPELRPMRPKPFK